MRAAFNRQTERVHVRPPTPKLPEAGEGADNGDSWKFDDGASGVAKCLPRGVMKRAKSTVVALYGSVLEAVEEGGETSEVGGSQRGSHHPAILDNDVGMPVPGAALLEKQSKEVAAGESVSHAEQ
jgi:hypothetical protein